MTLAPDQMLAVRAFVAGRVQGLDCVLLADELAAVREALPITGPAVEGMDVSKALRAAGFNRAYEVNGRKATDIIYKRTDAPIDQGQSARRDYDATERDMIRRGKEAEAKVHWHKRTGK